MATNGAAAEKASSATCPGNGGDVWRLARNSCAKGEALVFMPLNRNCSLPVDKSIDLAAPEADMEGCKRDRSVTVHRSGDVRFFTESVDKYVNSAQASWEDPVFMRVLRVLPKF